MLQGEHSAILLAFIKLPFVIKIFVLSIFEWPFYTVFTVNGFIMTKSEKAGQNQNMLWPCLCYLPETIAQLNGPCRGKTCLRGFRQRESVTTATETSYEIRISLVASLDMILSY